jgi:hypothetical protein
LGRALTFDAFELPTLDERIIISGMGLLGRVFGAQPPALPTFEYELMWLRGNEAVERAMQLREEWKGSASPVIIGTLEEFNHLTGHPGRPATQESLAAAVKVDLAKWFAENARDLDADPEYSVENAAHWDTQSGTGLEFSVVREVLSRKAHRWVLVAKIPTAHPYEVAAYLKFGDWNSCPGPAVHVALWKKWQEEYGAEILCVSGDVVEATVARPPIEKEDCYRLAREQYTYCGDIVDQGVETIDALAAILRDGRAWYFWWD